ncbi:Zinc-binding dehydrogenase-like protein 7 [Elsinoe fawcettii]|nr:Zinc-binding dehydrogenase-like protein 7 [Elsinoe fawcettii]
MSKQVVFRNAIQSSHEDIEAREELIPVAKPGGVVIEVKAVSLNYRDLVIAGSGLSAEAKASIAKSGTKILPIADDLVPTSDASGEIIEIGQGVSDFKVGDHVVVTFDESQLYGLAGDMRRAYGGGIDGFLRQYADIPASSLVRIPKETPLTWAQWACLPCAGVTAWNALYGLVPLRPAQTVLIEGTGGVSIIALLLAKAAGAKTIVTSSSDDKLKIMKDKYSADYTINYKTHQNWSEKVLECTNGEGVDHVIENGGVSTIEQSINSAKRGTGVVSIIGMLSGFVHEQIPNVPMQTLLKTCVLRGIYVGPRQMLEDLVRVVTVHNLQMPVDQEFEFTPEGVQAAFGHLKAGKHIGKVCIAVNPY